MTHSTGSPMLIAALAASALAIALLFLSSAHQRWLRAPLPAFPTRVSAALAVLVASKAWTEAFDIDTSVFAWLIALTLAAVLFSCLARSRRRSAG